MGVLNKVVSELFPEKNLTLIFLEFAIFLELRIISVLIPRVWILKHGAGGLYFH